MVSTFSSICSGGDAEASPLITPAKSFAAPRPRARGKKRARLFDKRNRAGNDAVCHFGDRGRSRLLRADRIDNHINA